LVLMQAKRSKHPLGPNFQHQHNFVQMQPMTRMPMPMMAPGIPGAQWMFTCPTTGMQYMSKRNIFGSALVDYDYHCT
jgi:hypothetical protein